MPEKRIPAPPKVVELAHLAVINHFNVQLFDRPEGGLSWTQVLAKSVSANLSSAQSYNVGERPHPYDVEMINRFQLANVHHAACIHTEVESTVGLGFETEKSKQRKMAGEKDIAGIEQSKVDEALDPMCDNSFADVMRSACEDYWQSGTGYIEVVRAELSIAAPITGLHHMPAAHTYFYVEPNNEKHIVYKNSEGVGADVHLPIFGEADLIKGRATGNQWGLRNDTRSEVIVFRRPTALNRFYGFAHWLSCVSLIEMVQMMIQNRFDFFNNRGVPEFMLFITGATLTTKEWKKIEDNLQNTIGLGNQHKSLAINLPYKEMQVVLHKLALDGKQDESTAKDMESSAMGIVSAHRVPPLLAGIQIPGKLGATNELPNALKGFQALTIGPEQRIWQQTLGRTLGNSKINGGLGLTADDFLFRKITDEIDVAEMDTVSRMREPLATAKGRDLSAGMKD